jgi:hypothetical protein
MLSHINSFVHAWAALWQPVPSPLFHSVPFCTFWWLFLLESQLALGTVAVFTFAMTTFSYSLILVSSGSS